MGIQDFEDQVNFLPKDTFLPKMTIFLRWEVVFVNSVAGMEILYYSQIKATGNEQKGWEDYEQVAEIM